MCTLQQKSVAGAAVLYCAATAALVIVAIYSRPATIIKEATTPSYLAARNLSATKADLEFAHHLVCLEEKIFAAAFPIRREGALYANLTSIINFLRKQSGCSAPVTHCSTQILDLNAENPIGRVFDRWITSYNGETVTFRDDPDMQSSRLYINSPSINGRRKQYSEQIGSWIKQHNVTSRRHEIYMSDSAHIPDFANIHSLMQQLGLL